MDTTDVPCEKETKWRNVYCREPDGEVLIDAWSPDSDTSAWVDLLLSSNDRLNHSSLAPTWDLSTNFRAFALDAEGGYKSSY